MNELSGIAKKLKEILPSISEKYGISELGIFGSYIRNEHSVESDIDILVTLKDPVQIGLFEFWQLEDELSHYLNLKVDLVDQAVLKAQIGKRILREVIYILKEIDFVR